MAEYNSNRYTLTDLAEMNKPYGVVCIDPPYTFETWSDLGKDRSAENHYLCQSDAWLAELPIKRLTRPDTALCVWAIDPKIEDTYRLIRAWGFIPVTPLFTWVKLTPNCPETEFRPHMGMGYYTRKNPEMAIAAERPDMFESEISVLGRREETPQRKSRSVRQLIVAPVREHSRKPDEMYQRVEDMFDGPYLELFARHNPARPPYWDAWGREVG